MFETARKNIARRTLAMAPAIAGVMGGGMTFAEAYRIVFQIDLIDRCRELIATYGVQDTGKLFEDGGVCWELSQYNLTPQDALNRAGVHTNLIGGE